MHMAEAINWNEVGVTRIPLSGKHGTGYFVLVDGDYDGEHFSRYTWYLNSNGYVCRKSYKNLDGFSGGMIYLHDEVCRKPPGMWVDHINRNPLDNRSRNLRPVTPKQNAANRHPRAKREPGYLHCQVVLSRL